MAPRTRHKYAQEHAIIRNSRGFAAFPTELLHHVASHIEGTTISWYQDSPFEGQRNKRRDALRALCQLCRSLRTALLPLVWKVLEAYTLLPASGGRQVRGYTAQVEVVGKELLGQLRLVNNVKLPYASHVRIVTVAIYPKFGQRTLTRLARAMKLMPNLHTIHIMCGPFGYGIGSGHFQAAFSGLVFPSVRLAILPATAQTIFRCFPEVAEVFTNHPRYFNFSRFLDNMISHCPKVESIGWRELPGLPQCPFREVQRNRNTRLVVEKLPNLRRVKYYMMSHCYYVDEIMGLLPLNLEKITLVSNADQDADSAEVGQMIGAAQQVLAGSSLPNKCLEVILGGERQMVDIPDKAS